MIRRIEPTLANDGLRNSGLVNWRIVMQQQNTAAQHPPTLLFYGWIYEVEPASQHHIDW